MNIRVSIRRIFLAVLVVAVAADRLPAQALTSLDRERGKVMLEQVHKELREHYYDPTFGGMDLNARVKQAGARIDTAKSNSEVFGVIAQLVSEINDSYTYFVPPDRTARVRYGWEMIALGDSVHILAVKPGSDAAKKGLRPGDRVLSVNGFEPTRENRWKLRYLYWVLRPQPFLRVTVRDTAGQTRALQLDAEVQVSKQLVNLNTDEGIRQLILELESEFEVLEPRTAKVGDILLIQLSNLLEKLRYIGSPLKQTDKARSVVLDLRGNGAGMSSALIEIVGAFVEQETLVAYALRRNEIDTIRAEPKDPFKGRLVVLIDSRTGGAAELFARLMQLSARATIVGDWSSGTGHLSTVRWQETGAGRVVPYGVSLSTADLRLADGKTLERRGVMPDEFVVPAPADLAAGRDPALARAIAIAGGSLDPLAAGKIFPARWKR